MHLQKKNIRKKLNKKKNRDYLISRCTGDKLFRDGYITSPKNVNKNNIRVDLIPRFTRDKRVNEDFFRDNSSFTLVLI